MSPTYKAQTGSLAGKVFDLRRARSEKYFVGVDGGGTKTRAIVTNESGQLLGEGQGGAANPHRVGWKDAVANIADAVRQALRQARLSEAQIAAAGFGIAGVSHPIHYHTMQDALERALDIEHMELVTDAKAALTGALDGKPGVIVIAGTGSIALGVNAAGEEARSGGYGPTFSDEGSAYDISRRALKAIAAACEGRAPETRLSERFFRELGIASATDLPSVIYTEDARPAKIAALAEVVAEVAQAGDEVARQILAEAGAELGQLAVSVIQRLGLEGERFRVAFVGSVFNAGDSLFEPFRRAILAVAPRAEISEPVHPPTMGAVKLAQMMFEQE